MLTAAIATPHRSGPESVHQPVAVIGIGCRFAGGVDSTGALWEALIGQCNLVGEIPAGRWDVEDFYDPEPGVAGRSVSRWGAFLEDPFGFDAGFFRIGAEEAAHMDPQQRALLEVSVEALEHAGIPLSRLPGSRTAVFTGASGADYLIQLSDAGKLSNPYAFTGTSFAVASGRIAYLLDLRGPAVSIDTSCSGSLAAVHLAMRSLRWGECDIALAGGVSMHFNPEGDASASAQGMLSPRGRCAAFDKEADGFVRGEGCAVVVLKRLADAVGDGDRVLAVLRGSAINQDGRSQGLTAPNGDAQEQVQRIALADAGIDPATVGLVEAHGTGTPVGDPVEWEALRRVYGRGEHRCAVGSIKTNLGHTEMVSGVAGLIKAVEATRRGQVPANLHFTELNPALRSEQTRLFIPTSAVDWPAIPGPRRAAVSSYGMSGTNAHVIIEAAPAAARDVGPRQSPTKPWVFVLSASDAESLSASASRVADWLSAEGADAALCDVAHTLACRRTHRPHRLAVAACTREDLVTGLRAAAGEEPRAGVVRGDALGTEQGPVWVFSGHGGQWPGMGRSLLAHDGAFRAAVDEVDALVAAEAGFSVVAEMLSDRPSPGLKRVQPTIFAIQVGLAASWRARGVQPAAVIGQSMGEVAAAVVAGRMTPADGVKVICRRTALMARVAGGAMASIELPVDEIEAELGALGDGEVVIGVYSSPTASVISGDADRVHALVEKWVNQGVPARLVQVEVASHSSQVDPVLGDIAAALQDLKPSTLSEVTFYPTAVDSPVGEPQLDAHYWARNLRNPVFFSAAVQAALGDGHRVFVEVSPHPLALNAVGECAAAAGITVATIPTLRREQDDADPISEQVGAVHCAGARVDFGSLYRDGTLVDLPLPAWSHQQFAITAATTSMPSRRAQELTLAEGIELPGTPGDRVWQADIGNTALPWVEDHRIYDTAVFPGAAFADLALAAAEQLHGAGRAEIRDLTIDEVLFVSDHTMLTMVAECTTPSMFRWTATSHADEDHRVRHASAALSAVPDTGEQPAYDLAELYGGELESVDIEALRRNVLGRGVYHGPSFRGLSALYRVPDHPDGPLLVGELRLPAGLHGSRGRVHPVLLDACFQALLGSMAADDEDALLLPVGIRCLRSYGITAKPARCVARLNDPERRSVPFDADIDVLDEQGRVLLRVEGLVLDGATTPNQWARELTFNQRVLGIEWKPADPADNGEADIPPLNDWTVLTEDRDADPFAEQLADALMHWGAASTLASLPLDDDDPDATRMVVSDLGSRPRSGLVVLCPAAPGDGCDVDLDGELLRVWRLMRIVSALAQSSAQYSPRLCVVTRGAQQVGGGDDNSARLLSQTQLRGLCRVIGAEHPELRIVHVDIDESTDASALAYDLAVDDSYDETAWRHNRRHVAVLRQDPLQPADRRRTVVRFGHDNFTVVVREPGDLETVEYQAIPRIPPGPGEVQVRNLAVSVNFADVLASMGAVQTYDGGLPPLGVELAGEISAVGEGVTRWSPGDRVIGLARPGVGAWRAFDTLPAEDVYRIPDAVSVADAAAFIGPYLTAWYSLHTLARLERGERVLIHSATGGVGMAAIAIAQLAGAQIFATAGTPQKRALLQWLGVDNVYDSRSVEFADQIRADTGGEGVDVVLNSLSGHAQRVSIDLVSIGGRFVEIGKKDIYADSKIGLAPFRRNIAFYSVDLLLLRSRKVELCKRLIGEVLDLISHGRLPLIPHTDYRLDDVATALRTMASAQHTGKLVLTFPTEGSGSAFINPSDVAVARRDGAYILTGGLGGLGLLLARHLADAGAGRIVVNSRSQPNGDAAEVIATLRSRGVDIVVELGDICQPATAHRLIRTATMTGLPVRGIVHAAAVVDDAAIINIDRARLQRNWDPKVLGAWNLHTAIGDAPLDWFCCFSSAAALLGTGGQGSYAAANSWMDGLMVWRRQQGLPATTIAWGPWGKVGRGAFLGEDGHTAMISPDEGMHAFDRILRHDRSHVGYLPAEDSPWIQSLAQRSPFAAAFAAATEPSTTQGAVRHELRQIPAAERPSFLQKYLCNQIAAIIRAAAVDPGRRFTECGLDSLGKLELRTRIDKDLGIRVSTQTLWEHDTAHTLALHLLDRTEPSATTADDAVLASGIG